MGRSYWMPWRVRFPVALLLTCIRAYGTTDLTGVTLVPAVDAGVDISADIDTLRETGQLVNVKWSGVKDAQPTDVVALAALSPDGQGDILVRWRPVSDASGGASGSGTVQFRVLNYRVPLRFLYLQDAGSSSAKVVARSDTIKIRDVNEPLQGHLALTDNPKEVTVMWTSKEADVPRVYWGRQSGNWEGSVTATSNTVTLSGRCGALGPQTLNRAVMTGLEPGTTYYYKFGDVKFYFSPVHSFRTPPLTASSSPAKVLFFSDAGQATIDGSLEPGGRVEGSLATARALAADVDSGFGLLVNGGDLVQSESPFAWDTFFDEFSGSLLHAPLQATASAASDTGGCGAGVSLAQRFDLDGGAASWYSYDYGPIHFLHYDSSQDMSSGSPQYTFLSSDLAGVDRSNTPWVVVVGHQPVFPSSDASTMSDVQTLLQTQKVDLVLQGSNDWYERASPTYKGVVLPAGGSPVYVVAGNAGHALDAGVQRSTSSVKLVAGETGYIRLVAEGGSLQVESVASTSGTVLDSFSVVRNTGGAGVDAASATGSRSDTETAAAPAGGGAGTVPGPAPGSVPSAAPAYVPAPAPSQAAPAPAPGDAATGASGSAGDKQAAASVSLTQGGPPVVDGEGRRTPVAPDSPAVDWGVKPVDQRVGAGSGGDVAAPAAAPRRAAAFARPGEDTSSAAVKPAPTVKISSAVVNAAAP